MTMAHEGGSVASLSVPAPAQPVPPPISPDALIGAVTALFLRDQLVGRGATAAELLPMPRGSETAESGRAGTARFIIDRLSAQQTAAIARAVSADPNLSAWVDIKLPQSFVGGQGLPAEMLTDKRATWLRNAPCLRPALLLANTGDDEDQSLRELTPVGSPELVARPAMWVQAASAGIPIADEDKRWWEKALGGLGVLQSVSLDRFAAYVLSTRELVDTESALLHDALDAAGSRRDFAARPLGGRRYTPTFKPSGHAT